MDTRRACGPVAVNAGFVTILNTVVVAGGGTIRRTGDRGLSAASPAQAVTAAVAIGPAVEWIFAVAGRAGAVPARTVSRAIHVIFRINTTTIVVAGAVARAVSVCFEWVGASAVAAIITLLNQRA